MTKRNNALTVERLQEVLEYRADTGKFYRRTSKFKRFIGAETGKTDKSGYIHVFIDGGYYQAHRLAWLYVIGEWPMSDIDHINRVKNDNRICNLREATASQNGQNTVYTRGVSKYRGVTWHKNNSKWVSMIWVEGKPIWLGSFETEKQASLAYETARDKLHPFYVGA